jgi:hypothetical protein
MNSIRFAAALALAISTGAFARGTAASAMPDQVQCTDGTIATKAGRGACSHHGGIARTTQSAPTTGAANRALPPTERAPDNPASQSPWSIFGGKRKTPAPAQSTAPAPAVQGRSAAPISRSPRQSSAPATTQPTAKCRDGSASYSAHHSGSCSHHGGVAEWLDGR